MFIPMWLIVVLVVVAVLYVSGVKNTHNENVQRVDDHLERLKNEAKWIEKNLANDLYRLAYHFMKHKEAHVKELIYLLKTYRDHNAVDRAEWFLDEPNKFQEEFEEAIDDIHSMTGFDLADSRYDQQGYEWYKEEEQKYEDQIEEMKLLLSEIKNELD